VAIDPNSLPRDAETLRKIVVDLAEQLDRSLAEQNKYQSLLRELLEAQRNRKSEQLSKEQLALFEAAWKARSPEDESAAGEDDDDLDGVRERVQNRTKRKARSAAGVNRWHGI
jgi:hemerythrin-like domain-containing protein